MMHFILVTTPVYVTLFWAIVLLTGKTAQNKSRLMLGLFMFNVALLYCCHAVFMMNKQLVYLVVDAFYLLFSLSVYPLYYWYVKLLTSETQLQYRNLFHFIPAVVLSVALGIFHSIAGNEDRMEYLQEVLISDRRGLLSDTGYPGWLARIYLAGRLVFVAQVILYALLGYRLAGRHNRRLENYYSELENRRLVWVMMISIALLLTSLATIAVNIVGKETFLNSEISLAIPSLIFSFLFFVVGLQGERLHMAIREMGVDTEENTIEKMTGKSRAILKKRLDELMIGDKLYLIPDLKITTLCKILNTNRTYISNLINEETGGNFNAYVNRYRVDHAIGLMNRQGASQIVINYIAQESGFGSSGSFIRAFKAYKGITPGKYVPGNQDENTYNTIPPL
jgi:AraC-like DNA-binding protein